MLKVKKYANGAILIYKKRKKKCTTVNAGFVFGKNREKYSEPTAHFCEHMLFKETESKNEKEFRQYRLDTLSKNNAYTSPFYLFTDFCRSNKALEKCFALESEMLLSPKFSKKLVENEKGVIKQELVRKINNPQAKFALAYRRTLLSNYNKDTIVLGSEEEIDAITAKELRKFKNDTFISENFVISIVGGISYHKAKKLAERYYINNLKSNPKYTIDKTLTIPIDKPGNLNIENFPHKKSICRVTIKLPDELRNDKSYAMLNMLQYISNGLSGKLFCALRDKGLVYSAHLDYVKDIYDSTVYVDFECSNENVNSVIDTIGQIFDLYRSTPFENELLARHKANKKLNSDEQNPLPIYPEQTNITYLRFGKEVFTKQFKKNQKKIFNNLTPEDLQEFCKQIFTLPENIYVTILTDETSKDKFYSYETIQKILTTSANPNKIKKNRK